MYHTLFIYSSTNECLGCFQVLSIVNSAAVNMEVHAPFEIMVFSGCTPTNGIAESYGSFNFSFLRILHSVLYSGCRHFHLTSVSWDFAILVCANDGLWPIVNCEINTAGSD